MIANVDQRTANLASRALRRTMALRLAMWTGASWLLGLALLLASGFIDVGYTRAVLESFAAECVIWGLLGSGVALLLLSQSSRGAAAVSSTGDDRDRARRVLAFSSLLLLALFVPFGVALIVIGLIRSAPQAVGHGAGVMLQAGFLVLFDRAFSGALRQVDKTPASADIQPSSDNGPSAISDRSLDR